MRHPSLPFFVEKCECGHSWGWHDHDGCIFGMDTVPPGCRCVFNNERLPPVIGMIYHENLLRSVTNPDTAEELCGTCGLRPDHWGHWDCVINPHLVHRIYFDHELTDP
jgi:hypothetical protein